MSAALVTAALVITGFGIATAVYLDRPSLSDAESAPERTAPPPVSVARAQQPLSAVAGSSLPTPSPHSVAALAALAPEAGKPAATPTPSPAATPAPSLAATPGSSPAATPAPPSAAPAPPRTAMAALVPPAPPSPAASPAALPPAPAALPPSASSPTAYWVEYGVFDGERYAARLREVLARSGLESVIVRTHDLRGRPLLRVRSAPLDDFAAAHEAAQQAETALGIAPLIHRGSPDSPGHARRYWVQFGAFRDAGLANRLRHRLAKAGIAAAVSSTRGTSGKPLYLVRTEALTSHANAVALAQRGQPVTQAAALIGERRQRAGGHHPPRAPPRHIASAR